MTRFGKGNHDIYEQVNRKDKHGEMENTLNRLPHKAPGRRRPPRAENSNPGRRSVKATV